MTRDDSDSSQQYDGPRERLRRLGCDSLSDAELLALILGTGRPGEPVLPLSSRILEETGGARGLLRVGPGPLTEYVGYARAARIVGALELVRRGLSTALDPRSPYGSSRDVVRAYGPRLIDRTEEHVIAIVLDGRHRPIAERQIATGGPSSCAVGIRDVFALAVKEGGAATILIHNHPSGDPTPSREDVTLTTALFEAGRILELPFLDHVIVGREGSFSFLDAGLLRAREVANECAGRALP